MKKQGVDKENTKALQWKEKRITYFQAILTAARETPGLAKEERKRMERYCKGKLAILSRLHGTALIASYTRYSRSCARWQELFEDLHQD